MSVFRLFGGVRASAAAPAAAAAAVVSIDPDHCVDQSAAEELTCAICVMICAKPLNLACGHLFCEACLRRLEPPRRCPACRQEFDLQQVGVNQFVVGRIENLLLKCPRSNASCIRPLTPGKDGRNIAQHVCQQKPLEAKDIDLVALFSEMQALRAKTEQLEAQLAATADGGDRARHADQEIALLKHHIHAAAADAAREHDEFKRLVHEHELLKQRVDERPPSSLALANEVARLKQQVAEGAMERQRVDEKVTRLEHTVGPHAIAAEDMKAQVRSLSVAAVQQAADERRALETVRADVELLRGEMQQHRQHHSSSHPSQHGPGGVSGKACFAFKKKGACRYGAGCRYSHAAVGSAAPKLAPASSSRASTDRTELEDIEDIDFVYNNRMYF